MKTIHQTNNSMAYSIMQKLPAVLSALFLLGGNLLMAAEAKADSDTKQDILATIPEAKDYQLVYDLDIGKVGNTIAYAVNNSAQVTQPFDRVAYLLELTKGGQSQWVYVSMDSFTDDAKKIGVPTFESKAVFQQYVTNLNVLSNVKEITTGNGLKGNIEFWPNNYITGNALNIPGASSATYDFGDTMSASGNYGSMQVHNYEAKQTLFAFNQWRSGGAGCDLGIGNSPGDKATDWTFAKNGAAYESKRLRVLVRMAPGFQFKPTPAPSASAAAPVAVPAAAPIAKPDIKPETKPVAASASQVSASSQDNLSAIPEAKDYQLVYDLDIGKVGKTVAYDVNNSAQVTQPFDRVAYLLELTKGGQSQWVYVSMDTFTADAGKIGVPTFESKAVFQQYVTNLNVLSNVKEITTGNGLKGNIEFWANNYSPGNALNIPGASATAYDFGDTMSPDGNYGSMQVHNYEAKQTLFAFNQWRAGGAGCDLGIGNSPGNRATDWTFTKNGAAYETKRLRVLVRMAPGFQFKPAQQSSSAPATTPTTASAPTAAPVAAPASHVNPAITPSKHAVGRTDSVIKRAQDAPGNYDIEFIGDSITQGWEGGGRSVWQEFYGKRKVINMGVSGDRTEHVLWRFENGQLDGIKAKVAVVMIGTNNSGRPGSDSDILEGVVAVVNQIRTRQPDTKVLLLGIFPRGNTFSPHRGQLLQINQVLAKLDDGKNIFYLDFGSQYVLNDGAIDKSTMPDALHPNEAGYKVWANAMEPKLKQLLGE